VAIQCGTSKLLAKAIARGGVELPRSTRVPALGIRWPAGPCWDTRTSIERDAADRARELAQQIAVSAREADLAILQTARERESALRAAQWRVDRGYPLDAVQQALVNSIAEIESAAAAERLGMSSRRTQTTGAMVPAGGTPGAVAAPRPLKMKKVRAARPTRTLKAKGGPKVGWFDGLTDVIEGIGGGLTDVVEATTGVVGGLLGGVVNPIMQLVDPQQSPMAPVFSGPGAPPQYTGGSFQGAVGGPTGGYTPASYQGGFQQALLGGTVRGPEMADLFYLTAGGQPRARSILKKTDWNGNDRYWVGGKTIPTRKIKAWVLESSRPRRCRRPR